MMRKILLLLICLSFLAVPIFAGELFVDWANNGSCEVGTLSWSGMRGLTPYVVTQETSWASHSSHSCMFERYSGSGACNFQI